MSTYFRALSASGNPEQIFYDGRCLYKVRTPMPNGVPLISRVGTVVKTDEFVEFDDCEECSQANTMNTMFVRYE